MKKLKILAAGLCLCALSVAPANAQVCHKTLEAGYYVAAIQNNGNVLLEGITSQRYYKQSYAIDTTGWSNIIDLAGTQHLLAGLRDDGIVFASGPTHYFGHRQVTNWSNLKIVDIEVSGKHIATTFIIGMIDTGRVKIVGTDGQNHTNTPWIAEVESWENIASITGGGRIGLTKGGKVMVAGNPDDVKNGWDNIKAISHYEGITAGLTRGGTVVSDPYNHAVSMWEDIVSVHASTHRIIGVKRDGTVVAEGNIFNLSPYTYNYKYPGFTWTGGKPVSIVTYGRTVYGVFDDGSVRAETCVPSFYKQKCPIDHNAIGGLSDVKAITNGLGMLLTLRGDGTLDNAGANQWWDVLNTYEDIRLPAKACYIQLAPGKPSEMVAIVNDMLASSLITNAGFANSLVSSLENAQAKLDRQNTTAAVNELFAIIRRIEAQSGNHIDPDAAVELVGYLEGMISEL